MHRSVELEVQAGGQVERHIREVIAGQGEAAHGGFVRVHARQRASWRQRGEEGADGAPVAPDPSLGASGGDEVAVFDGQVGTYGGNAVGKESESAAAGDSGSTVPPAGTVL